jgi:hypothetical protein
MSITTSPAVPEPQRHPVPTGSDLGAMIQVSEMLARSSLVPAAYRGKPENVLLATLAGQPFGWDPTMAMRSFHIIEGTPSLKPEIMLALVRRAGHSVSGDTSPTGATVTGTRRDTGDTMTVAFTMDDAKRAGLLGKRGPWQNYPQSMCWARALSQLCRMLFPDVVLGAGYTPEELGGVADDTPAAPSPATVTRIDADGSLSVVDAKRALLAAAGGDRDIALAIWTQARMDGETAIDPEALDVLCDDARAMAAEAAAEVVDAEVVDDTAAAPLADLDAEWSETRPEVEG